MAQRTLSGLEGATMTIDKQLLTSLTEVEYLPDYGRQLRAARLARKLSQGALAARVNMSKKHYQRVETGLQLPQLRTLQRLAGELGLAVALVKKEDSE